MGKLGRSEAAMKTATALHIGFKSHPGLHRTVNEDRILIDETRGVFLVVDGLGGHAAGETAAEIATQTIREYLIHADTARDLKEQIKEAITEANNRIFEVAQSHEQWTGMACVLTLAVAQDECVTLGHVGDSRLYLVWNGVMQKVTSDHSPVGELEEGGELTELEAMQHPRRHEVFRDVGSERRQRDDPEFVQIRQIAFPSDAALLLCTDGLTDAVTMAGIKQIVGSYRGNCEEIAEELVNAANESGGKDNVSVIFVAGPEFSAGTQPPLSTSALDRHVITRVRTAQSRGRKALEKLPWLLAGTLLGILIWATAEKLVPQAATPARNSAGERSPVHIAVNPMDARGIMNALAGALPGDIIDVPPGDYLGPLVLKNGVSLVGSLPVRPIVRTDPSASANPGVAVPVSGVHSGRIENLEVVSDGTHPLRIGISVANSTVHIVNSKVSGAIEAGIRIEGKSEAALFANTLTGNFGAGITAKDQSSVHLSGNWITNNGKVPGALRAGLEITPTVHWEAANNLLLNNGLDDLNSIPENEKKLLEANNVFARNADREPSRKGIATPPAARK
jgi:PPM family protein phosphatase